MSRPPIALRLGVLLLVLTFPLFARENPQPWHDEGHSHDQARQAVVRGEVLPITQVLQQVRERFPGDVVAMEYEFEFERWVYEFKIVDGRGEMRKIHVDAASGNLVSVADE